LQGETWSHGHSSGGKLSALGAKTGNFGCIDWCGWQSTLQKKKRKDLRQGDLGGRGNIQHNNGERKRISKKIKKDKVMLGVKETGVRKPSTLQNTTEI